jgi:RimJ/RimL family protein N-acetyltransferase
MKPRGSYWILWGHTKEEFRGLGCFTKGLKHIVEETQSVRYAPLIYVDARVENIPSRRAILSAGFSPAGVITTRQLWVPRLGSFAIRGSWQRQVVHPGVNAACPCYLPVAR